MGIYPKFHLRVFWSVIAVFLLLTSCFIGFQYVRERQYKIELLHSKLADYNRDIHKDIQQYGFRKDALSSPENVRVTVIDFSGNVLFDSEQHEGQKIENHADRKEVKEALQKGFGSDVRRQ